MATAPPVLTGTSNLTLATTQARVLPDLAVTSGQVLVLKAVGANTPATLSITSTGGQTWTLRQSVVVSSRCTLYIWTAIANTTGIISVGLTRGTTTGYLWGARLNAWDSEGVGVSASTQASSGAPTLAIDPTGNYSAIEVMNGDWNAVDGASRVWRTNFGALTEQGYERSSPNRSYYGGYHANVGVNPTSKAVGLTAPTQRYSIAAVEVFGTTPVTTVPKSGADSSSVSVAESVSLLKTISATDTSAVGISESRTSSIAVQRQDSSAIAVSESTARASVASDSNSIAVTESYSLTKQISTSDSTGIVVADSSTLSSNNAAASSDSSSISIVEALSIAKQVSVSDSNSIVVSESSTVLKQIHSTDTALISISESAAISSDSSSQDVDAVSIEESSALHKYESLVDSTEVAIDEDSTVLIDSLNEDSDALEINESVEIHVTEAPSKVTKVFHQGEWKEAVIKIYINQEWRVVDAKYRFNNVWY